MSLIDSGSSFVSCKSLLFILNTETPDFWRYSKALLVSTPQGIALQNYKDADLVFSGTPVTIILCGTRTCVVWEEKDTIKDTWFTNIRCVLRLSCHPAKSFA